MRYVAWARHRPDDVEVLDEADADSAACEYAIRRVARRQAHELYSQVIVLGPHGQSTHDVDVEVKASSVRSSSDDAERN
jgi:Asp/Glu/hydantoin racemase